jgi:ABC-2 type transport system ATP-binding protein
VNEIEEFLDEVIYLKKGEIALSGPADQLREQKGKSLEGIFEEVAG